MKIKAAIFDLDGTILSNESVYAEAFNQVLSELGIETKDPHPQTSGVGLQANWLKFIKKYDIKTDLSIKDLINKTQSKYLSLIDRVTFKKGFEKFAVELARHNLKKALATSNDKHVLEIVNRRFKLRKFFNIFTTIEEVENSKPAPDIFLLTAKKLEVIPEECVVFEDANAGIMAAKRAGMKAIGIANHEGFESLEGADFVVDDFTDISIETLTALG